MEENKRRVYNEESTKDVVSNLLKKYINDDGENQEPAINPSEESQKEFEDFNKKLYSDGETVEIGEAKEEIQEEEKVAQVEDEEKSYEDVSNYAPRRGRERRTPERKPGSIFGGKKEEKVSARDLINKAQNIVVPEEEEVEEEIQPVFSRRNTNGENKSKSPVLPLILFFGVALVIIIILLVTTFTYSSKYKEVNSKLEEYTKTASLASELQEENNSLKEQIAGLIAENKELKGESVGESTEGVTNTEDVTESVTSASASSNSSSDTSQGSVSEYTVTDGDNFWTISQKVYGDGSKYQKILDANGLNENSMLNIGQKLKIPN